ncbi:MAG: von Willebrand factor type A domain-containing protein [Sandaracinaceae bacterium]
MRDRPAWTGCRRGRTRRRAAAARALRGRRLEPVRDGGARSFSTFAADVDTASYDIFVRDACRQPAPDPASVRLEEYVNTFDYDYPTPEVDAEIAMIDLVAARNTLCDQASRSSAHRDPGVAAARVRAARDEPGLPRRHVGEHGQLGNSLAQMVVRETVDARRDRHDLDRDLWAEHRVVLGPTRASDRDTIVRAIDGLSASGGTDGGRGIQMAYEQARAGFISDGFNHVVLMTDGDFNIGITDTADLVALIERERETGVTLTALGFGSDNLNDAMMERVSNSGNGVYSVITSADHARRYAQEDILHTAHFVAQDMKIQVEFNPEHVLAYRLLGYENRAIDDMLFRDDTVDAGEVGAGLRVTALYEVVLAGQTIPEAADAPPVTDGEPVEGERTVAPHELVRVRVRWKDRGATAADLAHETMQSLTPDDVFDELFADTDQDFLWASAMAAFAEILHHSPYADLAWLERIDGIVQAQRTRDDDRAQLVELFESVRPLIEPPTAP